MGLNNKKSGLTMQKQKSLFCSSVDRMFWIVTWKPGLTLGQIVPCERNSWPGTQLSAVSKFIPPAPGRNQRHESLRPEWKDLSKVRGVWPSTEVTDWAACIMYQQGLTESWLPIQFSTEECTGMY